MIALQLPPTITFAPLFDGAQDIFDSDTYHPPVAGQQETWCGKTWRDMPGAGFFEKKCNFFFFRRGMYQSITDDDGRKQVERCLGGSASRKR